MKKAQFEELLESVHEMKAIEKGLKKASRTFEFPPPNARQIRRKFQLTQSDFARLIGISVSTLRNWEQGLRVPEGPAQVLLRIVDVHPEAVFEVCVRPKIASPHEIINPPSRLSSSTRNGTIPRTTRGSITATEQP